MAHPGPFTQQRSSEISSDPPPLRGLGICATSITDMNVATYDDFCPKATFPDEEFENLAMRPLRKETARFAQFEALKYRSADFEALTTKRIQTNSAGNDVSPRLLRR